MQSSNSIANSKPCYSSLHFTIAIWVRHCSSGLNPIAKWICETWKCSNHIYRSKICEKMTFIDLPKLVLKCSWFLGFQLIQANQFKLNIGHCANVRHNHGPRMSGRTVVETMLSTKCASVRAITVCGIECQTVESLIHVNTTKLRNITCPLVATDVILQSLECTLIPSENQYYT